MADRTLMELRETPATAAVTLERDPLTGEILDIDGDISELLGLEPDDLRESTVLIARVHEDDRPHVAPATGNTDTLLYRLRHTDGTHVWVSERLAAIDESGVVTSQLKVVDTEVRHAQLEQTLSRLSDAVAIYELAGNVADSTQRAVVVVASNDLGADLLGQPGDQLNIGDIPELNDDESDFIELLADVIITGAPVALLVSNDETGAPATISIEQLDAVTAVVVQRDYLELEGVETSPSVLAGDPTSTLTDGPNQAVAADSVAQSGLLQLIGENPNPLEVLNGLAEHFSSECSTWSLDLQGGTAERTRCDEVAELPEVVELSTAALERLANLDEPVTHPDPAIEALQRRLGSHDGACLAAAPLPNGEIFLAERSEPWDNPSLEQLGLVAGFANVAAEANAALVAEDTTTTVDHRNDELLARAHFIGSVTRSLLAATSENFDAILDDLRDDLNERFDVADIELWVRNDRAEATDCDEMRTASDGLGDSVARWVHAVPCDGSTEICGAVRFIATEAQWDTDTLKALDAVAELIWEVQCRVQNERRLSGAFLFAPVAVTVLDADGTVTSCNDKYADFLGFQDSEELIGTPLTRHATVDGRQQIERLLASATETTADVPFRRTDESIVWGRVRLSTAPADALSRADADATLKADPATSAHSSAIAHIEDVTESILKQRALEYRVEHDDLTLLATRQRLTTAIAELTASDETARGATLLLIDLDTFESTRSRYGRDQADQVLRVVADRLRTLVRPNDLVARTGPAEFGILLSGDESDASALAERLLSSIGEPVLVRNTEITATANIGITAIVDTDQVSSVLRKADNALDAAKGAGRLRTATFDTALFEQLEREERLEADLTDAISAGEISMYYQPEVSLRTGELLSFETLARWDHPEFGVLESTEFVAHAERIGVIRDIDDLALTTACEQMQKWQTQFPGRVRSIRINISGTSIRSSSYVESIGTTLAAHNVDPGTVWFEISEDDLLRDDEAPLEQLDAIKSLGCKILIDDFGHGLSSFAVLRRLPVDALEIAPALIKSLGADPDATTIVAATIQLAQTLGLECVAEGVENHAQMTELIELGCQRAHGFLYGEASPPKELIDLITEGRVNIYDNEG